jgi:hypothetical protein
MKRLALVAIAVLAVSCRDQQPLQPPALSGPTALIVDASHEGTDRDFFFLPPLVPNPVGDSHFDQGAFNGRLSPTLSICRLLADLSCGPTILGPVNVPAAASEEHYQFLWNTSNLTVGAIYRVIVKLGTRELGVLDVQPTDKGVKNARTDDFYQFPGDRTVPIKFRIEFHGLSCPAGADCGDGRITNDGGLVTTTTGFAGALFPDGWLPAAALRAGITQVDVRITRFPVDNADPAASCLRSGLVEIEGCYRFETTPDLHSFGAFSEFVTAGICLEDPELEETDAPFQMHRREEVEGTPTGETVALESAAADFLTCGGFTATHPSSDIGIRSTGLLRYASAAWHALARGVAHIVKPRTLHAVDLGAGGSTDFFSRFGWARSATMVKVASTDNQTGPPGERLRNDPTVCLTLHHPRPHGEGGFPPLVDEPVTFTVTSVDGTVDDGARSTVVNTGEDGCASVAWYLGSSTSPGGNTLTAAARTRGTPQTFTATGVTTSVVRVGVNDFAIDLSAGRMQNPSGLDGSAFFNGTQVIFGAGFAYATSETDILVGYSTANQNSDFAPTAVVVVSVGSSETPHHTTAEVRPGGDRAGIPGVTVTQESFAFSNTADAGYVLLKYTLTNTNAGAVSNVFAGFVVDPDVLFSESQVDDVAAFNHDLSVAEVAENDQETHPQVIGIVPITSMETGLNYFAWVNGGRPSDPTTSAGWFDFLSTSASGVTVSVGPADVRFLTGVGPFSIPAKATRVVWFALVGGDDRNTFDANVAAARAKVQAGGI